MHRFLCLMLLTAVAVEASAAWTMHVIDDSARGPDGVRLADANGDGLPDIATAFEQGGVTRVYLHPGYEKVRDRWPMVVTGATPDAEDAVLVDLDADGAMDVVTCSEGKTMSVFVSWAPREPARYRDPSAWICEAVPALKGQAKWMFCLPMQVDGKLGIDLVIGAKDGRKSGALSAPLGWLEAPENPRDLSAWKWHSMVDVGWTMGIESADMDGDGKQDVIFTDRYGDSSGFHWLKPRDAASFSPRGLPQQVIGAERERCMFFTLADLDADGLSDASVITMDNKLHAIRRLNREGTQWQDAEVPLPPFIGRGKGVAAGDIDLDGRMDIVLSFEESKAPRHSLIWLSYMDTPYSGNWKWHALSGVSGVKNDQVRLADLDGDGDLDALTTEEISNLGVIWYENPAK